MAVPDLRSAIAEVLETYLESRTSDRFGKSSRGWKAIMRLRDAVSELELVRQRPHLLVKASAGQGQWTHIPWVALLDRRETSTTRQGVYVIFLFRADMSGVYLTLNQGVTEALSKHGPVEGLRWLKQRAATIRQRVPELFELGFESEPIDLRTTVASGTQYSASTIANVLIEAAHARDSDHLVRELSAVLQAYEKLVSG